jgi:AcrR family transcriptional regulator
MASDGNGRTRRARGSLSDAEILDGAHDLVARAGLDGLSMPALARHLGAGVTSIYWYFRNKEQLLLALAERVTHDLYDALPPIGDGAWDDELRSMLIAYRRVLRDTPGYNELFSVRPFVVLTAPSVLATMLERLEVDTALLRKAGFDPVDASRAFLACNIYARSFVLAEMARGTPPEDGDDEYVRMLDLLIEGIRRTAPRPLGRGGRRSARRR